MQETKISGIKAFLYTTTDSTNERAKVYANSGWNGEPTLFLANEQTRGRGRYSRKFYSKSGTGAYLSLLFKPNSTINDTTEVVAHTANSMISAIEELAPVTVNIKWVNDLILGKRKLGGILIEGSINPETKSYNYLIAGIGVNLYSYEMEEEIKSIATSIEAECGIKVDKAALISRFISHFLSGLDGSLADFCHRKYKSRLITLGKAVTVKTLTEEYDATAIDLLPDYSLLVRLPSGEEKQIFTGEARVKGE